MDWPVNRNTYGVLDLELPLRVPERTPDNFEDAGIQRLGRPMYIKLVEPYTRKFWGCDPKDLDAGMAKRLDPRTDRCNRFFTDRYQGVPELGYEALMTGLLDHPNIRVAFMRPVKDISEIKFYRYDKVYYTGCPDKLLGNVFGELSYRGVDFLTCYMSIKERLEAPAINHGEAEHPYIRESDYSYPYPVEGQDHTIIVKERPNGRTKAYPLQTRKARMQWLNYEAMCDLKYPKLVLCGRLGAYEYQNMDQSVQRAIDLTKSR